MIESCWLPFDKGQYLDTPETTETEKKNNITAINKRLIIRINEHDRTQQKVQKVTKNAKIQKKIKKDTVAKVQTTKLLILLRFYFHGISKQLKTNSHTNFRSQWVLGLVIDYVFRDVAFT